MLVLTVDQLDSITSSQSTTPTSDNSNFPTCKSGPYQLTIELLRTTLVVGLDTKTRGQWPIPMPPSTGMTAPLT